MLVAEKDIIYDKNRYIFAKEKDQKSLLRSQITAPVLNLISFLCFNKCRKI